MTIPRKSPLPAAGQVLTVTKPHTEGWISAWFWPADGGFHFVSQAVTGDRAIDDASDKPMTADWIPAIGMTFMLARGARASLVGSGELLTDLDGWRVEIIQRRLAKTLGCG